MDDKVYSHLTTRALSYAAIILSLAAIIASVVAIDAANNATKKNQGQDTKINELNKEVKLLDTPATTGAGVGPNSATQIVPNGSGQ